MARSLEEQELIEQFAGEYRRAQSPLALDLERAVCGCDYGGTSWTTRDEAERMGRLLELRQGRKLLEIGAGSGWPALYLAARSGCDATLADLPHDALRIAAHRAAREPAAGAIAMAVADGACLPFKTGQFDAICHSDVLCCLASKRNVLSECLRVIRRRARMVFTVISIAPGLSRADQARAVDAGPPFVTAECGYRELLEKTGWTVTEHTDVSAAYEKTGRRYIREVRARADEMSKLLGEAEVDELLAKRQRNVAAVADGIVRRELICAIPGTAG